MEDLLQRNKKLIHVCLSACASCTLCAESCFLFVHNDHDPRYMPSYKMRNSLGVLLKKGRRIPADQLQDMRDLVWKNCVLCGRCYCPVGIDIPRMIALARQALRARGVCGVYPHSLGAPEDACPAPEARYGTAIAEDAPT